MSTIEKAAARLAQKASGPSRGSAAGAVARASSPVASVDGAPPPHTSSVLRGDHRNCVIDLDSLAARGFLAPEAPRSQLAQEMRRIKRPLLLKLQKAQAHGDEGPPINLIMITSAVPGEGKTFTAINLAISLAGEVDRRVLLVDADVVRGDISRQLGITTDRGLADVLQEGHYLSEDAVLATNIERLSIMPGGTDAEHIDELFASEMMGVVLRSLADADPHRVVVFDAPPLLATTEAAVLARLVGQVVVVVEANKTPQNTVAEAIAQLEGCSNVSLILNKTTGKSGYGYGYGYGYGAGGTNDGIRQNEAG